MICARDIACRKYRVFSGPTGSGTRASVAGLVERNAYRFTTSTDPHIQERAKPMQRRSVASSRMWLAVEGLSMMKVARGKAKSQIRQSA